MKSQLDLLARVLSARPEEAKLEKNTDEDDLANKGNK